MGDWIVFFKDLAPFAVAVVGVCILAIVIVPPMLGYLNNRDKRDQERAVQAIELDKAREARDEAKTDKFLSTIDRMSAKFTQAMNEQSGEMREALSKNTEAIDRLERSIDKLRNGRKDPA